MNVTIWRTRTCAWCRTAINAAVRATRKLSRLLEPRRSPPAPPAPPAPTSAGHDQAEPWITKQELAERLGMSQRWIEKQIHKGMPSQRLGNRPRFKASAVEAWLRTDPDGTE
jgi:excisionase family DNA binding protein